jgi:hypothetical protein
MDAQRSRRTRDQARKAWYAYYRQVRFARWFGFIEINADLSPVYRSPVIPNESIVRSNRENAIIARH